MDELETSVEYYLDLMTQTHEDPPAREPQEIGEGGAAAQAPEVDHLQELIDTHTNELKVYSTRVINLRSNNIEIFRAIDRAMNPITHIATQVQAAPQWRHQVVSDSILTSDLRSYKKIVP